MTASTHPHFLLYHTVNKNPKTLMEEMESNTEPPLAIEAAEAH